MMRILCHRSLTGTSYELILSWTDGVCCYFFLFNLIVQFVKIFGFRYRSTFVFI